MSESLLNADAVAEITGLTRNWVYAETRAGRIPHIKLGRTYRYRRESIERWLAEIERGADTLSDDNRPPGPAQNGSRRP